MASAKEVKDWNVGGPIDDHMSFNEQLVVAQRRIEILRERGQLSIEAHNEVCDCIRGLTTRLDKLENKDV